MSLTAPLIERLNKHRLIPCSPPLYALTGHAQTIVGHLKASPKLAQAGKRIELELGDGDSLVGFFHPGTSNWIVYLFHGLSGSTDSTYMHRTALVALAQGHSVYLFNHRGCGAGRNLARKPYHSGRSDDLSKVIAFGRKNHPQHRHLTVGFSLSANASLLMSAGYRADSLPDATIAVNGPINLARAAINLTRGLNRIYDLTFVSEAKALVQHRNKMGEAFKLTNQRPWMSVYDFDAIYTGPASGYGDRDTYYQKCSAQQYLSQIQVPTILLTAADDPFVEVQDYLSAPLGPLVFRHIEPIGGHLGYLTRKPTPRGDHRWLDYALDEYMRVICQ